jgi:hypothetical protein
LPDEWRALLKTSGISPVDIHDHPDAVVEVLEYSTHGPKNRQESSTVAEIPKEKRTLKNLVLPEDPRKIFTKLLKLDEGYVLPLSLSLSLPTTHVFLFLTSCGYVWICGGWCCVDRVEVCTRHITRKNGKKSQ